MFIPAASAASRIFAITSLWYGKRYDSPNSSFTAEDKGSLVSGM
jgi:hypothetical protein